MVTLRERTLWLVGVVVVVALAALFTALVASGDGGKGSSSPDSETFRFGEQTNTDIEGTEITDQDTARWTNVWCDLGPGLTREEVYARMGSPTHESLEPQSSGQPAQSSWESGAYDFTVFFYRDGTVREYQINSRSVDPGIKAQLDCPLDRG